MASSYQGYARATGFQQLTATAAGLQRQREQDQIEIRALEKQKDALDKRAAKAERDLENKLNKEEDQRQKNYRFVEDMSYDNRVSAIKQNKQVELQSLQLKEQEALKRGQDLAQFSKTLANSLGKFKEKYDKSQFDAGYHAAAMEGLPSDSLQQQIEGSNKLYEQHLDIQKVGDTLWKEGSPINVVNNVKRSSAWWDYGAAQYRAEAAGDAFSFWIEDYIRDSGAIAPHEVQEALEEGRVKFLRMNNLHGYSSDFLAPTLKKMGAASRRLLANAQRGQDFADSQDMVKVERSRFHQAKDPDSMNRYFSTGMKSFSDNGERLKGEFLSVLGKDLINTDIFTDEQFDALMNSPTTDQPSKTWAQRHPFWYENIVNKREADKRTRFAENKARKEFEGKKYVREIVNQEQLLFDEGKRFSQEQLDQHIARWNPSWGLVPDRLLNMASKEDKLDEDIIDVLNEKIRKNQPIYMEDISGISDLALYQEYAKIAKDTNQYSIPTEYEDKSKERIIAAVNKHMDVTRADTAKTPTWVANKQQATDDYHLFYKQHIAKVESPREAHLKAIEEVEKKIKNGDYDSYPTSSETNTYIKNRETAQFAIGTDPNIIANSVIPGTEEDLKIYKESNGTVVPKIYEDLSKKLAMSPTQLANYQLEAVGEEPIISEIDQEIEKLPKHVQNLLTLHPDQQKVQRAKIELLKEDGNITFNDVGYLLDEVYAEVLPPNAVLGKLVPRIGDWKRLEKGTFIKWDGKQWIETGFFITGRKEFIGPAEEYLDKDLIRRKL